MSASAIFYVFFLNIWRGLRVGLSCTAEGKLWRWLKEAARRQHRAELMAGETEEVNALIISEFASVAEQQKLTCSVG